MKASHRGQERDLWTCPKCGRPFAQRYQSHSCGRYSVEKFLEGKSPSVVDLFNRFVELVSSCGPVTLAPARTRVGCQARIIFAAVNRLHDRSLAAHVVLSRRLENPRFTRSECHDPAPIQSLVWALHRVLLFPVMGQFVPHWLHAGLNSVLQS
ncbi:MAG TPA: hypothetical protein VMW58_05290 [Anaerolineae bacterium]|nr:hypothetical protein [Anaerolineae bacterium]